jgi:hypothetical protein
MHHQGVGKHEQRQSGQVWCHKFSWVQQLNSMARQAAAEELGRRFHVPTNIASRKFLTKRDILNLKRMNTRSVEYKTRLLEAC